MKSKSKHTTKPEPSQPPKKRKEPILAGRPKKKTSKLQQQALERIAALTNVRRRDDEARRRVGEVALTRTWIDKAHLDVEPLLHELMWVEYRYMNALERTERFTKEYIASYRRAYAKHFSPIEVAKKRPLAPTLAGCSPDEINALAHARAHADALGVPYDVYCDVIIDGHLSSDRWEQPPRPNQMFGKLAPPRLRGRPTKHEIHERLLRPDWDPRFFSEADSLDPVREAAWKLLCDDVHCAPDRVARLSSYLWRPSISERRARELLDRDLVDEAIAYGGSPSAYRDDPSLSPPTLSCFGFVDPSDSAPCVTCSIRSACVRLDADVRQELTAMTGVEDPRLAHKRRVDRERKRRQRQRQRNASSPTQKTIQPKRSRGAAVAARAPTAGRKPMASESKPTRPPSRDDLDWLNNPARADDLDDFLADL